MILSLTDEQHAELRVLAGITRDPNVKAWIEAIQDPERARISQGNYDLLRYEAKKVTDNEVLASFPEPGPGIASGEIPIPGVHQAVLALIDVLDAKLILNVTRMVSREIRRNSYTSLVPGDLPQIALTKVMPKFNEALLSKTENREAAYRLILFDFSDLLWFRADNPAIADTALAE